MSSKKEKEDKKKEDKEAKKKEKEDKKHKGKETPPSPPPEASGGATRAWKQKADLMRNNSNVPSDGSSTSSPATPEPAIKSVPVPASHSSNGRLIATAPASTHTPQASTGAVPNPPPKKAPTSSIASRMAQFERSTPFLNLHCSLGAALT